MTCETARQREARQGMVGLGKGWGGPSGEGLAAFFFGRAARYRRWI